MTQATLRCGSRWFRASPFVQLFARPTLLDDRSDVKAGLNSAPCCQRAFEAASEYASRLESNTLRSAGRLPACGPAQWRRERLLEPATAAFAQMRACLWR